MKIFFVTPKLNFITAGGTTDEYDLTYRTLLNMGHDVAVVTAFSKANNIPFELPYKVYEERIPSKRQLGIQKGLFKIFRKYSDKADIFFVDGQVGLDAAGMYRVFGGQVPVVAYFNRELFAWPANISTLFPMAPKGRIFKKIKQKIRFFVERYLMIPFTDGIDLVPFTSPFLEESYKNFGMKTTGKSMLLGDAFDFRGLMKKYNISEDTYIKRNKTKGPYTIFYSSRMAPGKGFDLLLTAFSRLKNKDNFRLVLGGTGPEEQYIKDMVKDLKLESYVEMPGWMTKEDLYKRQTEQVDIFVQARWRRDMTSMSLQTAMLFGLPSVLPGGGGLQWVARDSAIYFEDNNVDDLARQIEQLGDNRDLRARLSKHCYVRMDHPEMNHISRITELRERMEKLAADNHTNNEEKK